MQRRRPSTQRRGGLVAGAVALAVVATSVSVSPTLASWLDDEWAEASVGVVSCDDPAARFASHAEGRMLSGQFLGNDLDTIAAASGMSVSNDGTTATPDPASAAPADPVPDAFANPLSVSVLSGDDIDLGQGILQLPLDNSTGVLGQYAMASADGDSVGAAGFVTDNGTIAAQPANGYPELGALDLKTLVTSMNPDVATLLGQVSNLSLDVGAVGARAALDGCDELFSGQTPQTVSREYLASGLSTTMESPTVSTVLSTLAETLGVMDDAVAGVAGNGGVRGAITSGVVGLVDGLLGPIALSVTGTSVSANLDSSAVLAFASIPFGDPNGIVEISFGEGRVTVDLVALLAAAYPGEYSDRLNGLPPNTHLLIDDAIAGALLESVLTTTLDAWLSDLVDVVLDSIAVTSTVDLRLGPALLPLAKITATATGSLKEFLDGEAVVTTTTQVLGLIDAGILDDVVSELVSGLGLVVGNAVESLLGVDSMTRAALSPALAAVTALSSSTFSSLFLDGVVALDVNTQNDPLTGGAEPVDWSGIPAGRYEVAALRVSILDQVGTDNMAMYLGRASVGPNCVAGSGC